MRKKIYLFFILVAFISYLGCISSKPQLPKKISPTGENLLKSARSGDIEGVHSILDVSPDLILFKDSNGNTALHQATNYDNELFVSYLQNAPAVVKLLLEKGADVNALNNNLFTPLHLVALYDKFGPPKGKTMELKINNRVVDYSWLDETQFSSFQTIMLYMPNVNSKAKNGMTPLHIAALFGHINMVKILLEKGSDPQAMTINGKTAMDLAKDNARTNIVDLLSKYGKK